jgi:hypothetical protein
MIRKAVLVLVSAMVFAGVAMAAEGQPNPDGPPGTWFMDLGGGIGVGGKESSDVDGQDFPESDIDEYKLAVALGWVLKPSMTFQIGVTNNSFTTTYDATDVVAKTTRRHFLIEAKVRLYAFPKPKKSDR